MGLNPEFREEREWDFEKRKFSSDLEERLKETLEAKKEVFADLILCPNRSCGVPVRVEISHDSIELTCSSCGWRKLIRRAE